MQTLTSVKDYSQQLYKQPTLLGLVNDKIILGAISITGLDKFSDKSEKLHHCGTRTLQPSREGNNLMLELHKNVLRGTLTLVYTVSLESLSDVPLLLSRLSGGQLNGGGWFANTTTAELMFQMTKIISACGRFWTIIQHIIHTQERLNNYTEYFAGEKLL